MGINLGLAGIVLAMVLLTACGGGSGGAVPLTQAPPDGPTPTAQQANLVVVRYDVDADGLSDVVTLDASSRPMVMVEGLRGLPEGDAVDVTDEWQGQPVDPELSDVLHSYLADSFRVGVETDLDVTLRGEPATITVIE